MPAIVAPEGFQAHQTFVADQTPELSGSFEAALILPTGGFDGPAALRFAVPPGGGVVQPPVGLRKPIAGQIPNPRRAVGDHQHFGRLGQALALRFGTELCAQIVHVTMGHHRAAADNACPSVVTGHALIQAKAGAAIGPMPALRFLAGRPLLRAVSPVVPLPDVPGIEFDHQREGFGGERGQLLGSLARAHLLVELLAFLAGPLALAAGFPVQRGRRQLHPGQSLNHGAGLFDRHFAGRQRGHFLHRGRSGAFSGDF